MTMMGKMSITSTSDLTQHFLEQISISSDRNMMKTMTSIYFSSTRRYGSFRLTSVNVCITYGMYVYAYRNPAIGIDHVLAHFA